MSGFLTILDHWVALVIAIILTAVSQVLLRSGAKGKVDSLPTVLLNSKILLGYMFFSFVVILMIYSMQEISLRTASALNSITFVLVPLMAHKFLKDPFSVRMMFGSVTIIIGVVVFLL